jgi:hypothetical protein
MKLCVLRNRVRAAFAQYIDASQTRQRTTPSNRTVNAARIALQAISLLEPG